MQKNLVIGLGQAGNKCVVDAVNDGVVNKDDTILINSTSRDFPEGYDGKKIVISPHNLGCGKEREISKGYLKNAIKQGAFNFENLNQYSTIVIVSSVEGGTGSGSTPILAQFFSQIQVKNVHVFALLGFNEDVRGIRNTLDFFKEVDSSIIVHTIANSAFLPETGGNKTEAEKLANKEFGKRYSILMGNVLLPSFQNIDDTDILKLSNTHGYTTVELRYLDKSLGNSDDYNKIVKRMIYESKSLKSQNPGATRMGVIFNLKESSMDAIGDPFSVLQDEYGTPFEAFKHIQYDGNKEYIAFIVSGMKLPIEAMEATYEKYEELANKVNRNKDEFFEKMKDISLNEGDNAFNMLHPVKAPGSVDDFLKKF